MAKKTATPRIVDPVELVELVDSNVPAGQSALPDSFDEVLGAYTPPVNTLQVEVLRSHDRLYEGQVVLLPNDDRTAGLIDGGYVQLVFPTILGVETFR